MGAEVTHCKDCKYWDKGSKIVFAQKVNDEWCYWCPKRKEWKSGDWFCADGVPKKR